MTRHISDQRERTDQPPLDRRAVLTAGGLAGATVVVLSVTGCATYSSGGPSTATQPGSGPGGGSSAQGAPDASNQGEAADQGLESPKPADAESAPVKPTGTALGPTSSVPVGGGTVFGDQAVVVTQPTAGVFRAFSAICTHQGCTVTSVSGGTINCPCHGSKFNIKDGSVAHGPAKSPLPAKKLDTQGGQLSVS
ncbi:MAG TPA: Rieske (2Fe-2S) protein [Pseudonocardia sp.]|jgi:Rieske Fe-S protein